MTSTPEGTAPLKGPGFTQRMLPELMREQARWVKSMPPTAASLLERAAAELDELVTLRRLHEEATSRAAALRTALDRIVEAEDDRRHGEGALKLFDRIAEARRVLTDPAPEPDQRAAVENRELLKQRDALRTALEVILNKRAAYLGHRGLNNIDAELNAARALLDGKVEAPDDSATVKETGYYSVKITPPADGAFGYHDLHPRRLINPLMTRPTNPPHPLDPSRFESTDYYRAKPHKAANDLIAALTEARGGIELDVDPPEEVVPPVRDYAETSAAKHRTIADLGIPAAPGPIELAAVREAFEHFVGGLPAYLFDRHRDEITAVREALS